MSELIDPARTIHEEFPSVSPRPKGERVGHIRHVMTTGLLKHESATPGKEEVNPVTELGGTALGDDFYVGDYPDLSDDFLDDSKESARTIENPSDRWRYEDKNKLEKGLKKDVYDFVLYLKNEKGYDIDEQAVVQRLRQARMESAPTDSMAAGDYFSSSRHVYIRVEGKNDITPESIYHTVLHELVHAASGQVFSVLERTDKFHSSKESRITESAVGLRRGKKFDWLNEAVTEIVTTNIRKRNDMIPAELKEQGLVDMAYLNEQNILFAVVKISGITLKDFVEAYFEEPDLHSPTGDRMPKWHSLQTKLTEAFGPRFLVKIEEMIKNDDPNTLGSYKRDKLKGLLEKGEDGLNAIERMHQEWVSSE
jgi:hypothetical protein